MKPLHLLLFGVVLTVGIGSSFVVAGFVLDAGDEAGPSTSDPRPASTQTARSPAPTPMPTPTRVPDTDGDGLTDAEELELGLDPEASDTDGDGLSDPAEIQRGSDPTAADSDGDGAVDGLEVRHGTNVSNPDTDGDGLDDRFEIENASDPLSTDTDGDGLDDLEEFDLGTSPAEADTDGDGLDDPREVNIHTDPTDADTDGDRYTDGEEVEAFPGEPLRMSIYVEVDVAEGTTIPVGEMNDLEDAFDTAPVTSKNGRRGIDLNFEINETDVETERSISKQDGIDIHYATEDLDGYHHLVVVEAIDGRTNGFGCCGVMVAASEYAYVGHVIMHELGHSLGLLPSRFDGIDSYEYEWRDYRSVMNYNSLEHREKLVYSNSAPYRDWTYIEEHPYRPD